MPTPEQKKPAIKFDEAAKTSIENWLNPKSKEEHEESQRKDKDLFRFARYIREHFEMAIELKATDILAGKPPRQIEEYLQEVWPKKLVEIDKDGAVSFTFDGFSNTVSDDLSVQQLHCITGQSSCNSNFFNFISINTEPIDSEDIDADKLRKAMKRVAVDITHEVEHCFYPGKDYTSGDKISLLKYLSNRGEMRAHAKGFARAYVDNFPSEKFDYGKLKALALQTPAGQNYFGSFLDPKKQQLYREYCDLQSLHDMMVALVRKFTEDFRAFEALPPLTTKQ
ncbi:MAG: hypothetical protein HY569_00535 [Candidatus Magasanikbacteria bacterium]|nr:hypothetical protein [Candidatus Magasanikbacteria bacterium]